MRLRRYLVGLAVITSSFIAVNPAEAQSRNGWYKGGCDREGKCDYVKKIGSSWPFVKYKINGPHGMFTQEADCQQWRRRFINSDGSKSTWYDIMPGSIAEVGIKILCR